MIIERLRSRWPGPLAMFIAVAVVYTATGTYGANQSRDTATAGVAAWALGARHTFNLGVTAIVRSNPTAFWIVKGAHGSLVSNRFPGAVLMATPLYALVGGSYSPVPGTITAALTAAGACALLYKVLLRLQPRGVALSGALLFAFATSNWTVSGRELWEHGGSELLIAAGMLALVTRRWAWCGLALGASVLFRPQLGVAAVVVGLGILLTERRWRPVLTFGFAAMPGAAAFLLWNVIVYGHWTISGGYSDVSTSGVGLLEFLDNVAGTLVSPERGALVYSPILLIAAIGLRRAWRSSPMPVRLSALGGLGYLASQLWLIRYTGGDGFFGYRTCLETLMFAAPLLVQAGVIGAQRVGRACTWIVAGATVSLFASAAFVQGETGAYGVDAWTHWGPIQFMQQYGVRPVLLGATIGASAVFAAWGLSRPRRIADDAASEPAEEASAPLSPVDAIAV